MPTAAIDDRRDRARRSARVIDDPFAARDRRHSRAATTTATSRTGRFRRSVYDFGWAELTSITAYRYNKYTRGQDADFNNLDILYRPSDGGSFNRFKTFSQELRLQGTSFGNHLDWLVGGYYANEKLRSPTT